ncbi:hypothetical protein THRCLA_07142 [Thraustotheca clavata]|uniref:Uncharacterized protein n=1 Tax=Thraustotheca clavata TaxID=74557 RepID=A0A1V9ZFU1_9STRA|nr:hypothetical protein THRCLA_07142 [Thraustotheca clavata]
MTALERALCGDKLLVQSIVIDATDTLVLNDSMDTHWAVTEERNIGNAKVICKFEMQDANRCNDIVQNI